MPGPSSPSSYLRDWLHGLKPRGQVRPPSGAVAGGLSAAPETGPAGEIDAHRWPGKRRAPGGQKQRSLQHKPIGKWGFRQAIEESLHGEVLEHLLERPPLHSGLVEEALLDGGAEVVAARGRSGEPRWRRQARPCSGT